MNHLQRDTLSLLNTQVIGLRGIKLQMKARNNDSTLDLPANGMIEEMWSQWTRKSNPMYSGCDVSGKFTFLGIQRQVLDAVVRDGEALIYVHDGRSNPHGIQLELMTIDRLNIEKNDQLQNCNIIRMGIEMEQRTRRPVAFWINVKENPPNESFAFSPSVAGTYERIPADKIIHVFHSERMEASRGVPWMASAMPHIKLLQAYLENEVVASSLASAKIATLSNNSGDEYVGSGVEDSYTPLSSMEAGSIEQLPVGRSSDRGTDLESLFAKHQQAKALAEQYGIYLAFEPYGTQHQSVVPTAIRSVPYPKSASRQMWSEDVT